jgi:flagellar export protein FliJ
MTGESKLQVVLSLRQLEEEISKVRLGQSIERLERSKEAVESTKAGLEEFRQDWKEAVSIVDSVQQLKLFPASHDRLKSELYEQRRKMEGKAEEVEGCRQDYAARQRTRKLLESLVARRLRRRAMLQEVRDQNERDEQVLLGYWSS